MGKKKVFIDAGPLLETKLSGIGHLVLNTMRTLARNERFTATHDIYLLAPIKKAHLLDQWQLKNVKVAAIPVLSRIWNFWPRLWVAPPLDLFLGRGIYLFPNYKRWPLAASPSLTWVHDIAFKFFPEATEPRTLKLLQNNISRFVRKSTRVLTLSEQSKKEILEHFPETTGKLDIVPCGVDLNFFTPSTEADIATAKQKYGIPGKYIFFLSNLEPRKNILRLLAAFTALPEEYKQQYSLVLVGGMAWRSEPIYAAIEKARQEGWGIIKPQNYVPDDELPALISGAEMLVSPALHEGFGLSPLQAMACGTPVAVSDIGAIREVVGDAGIYFDPCNEAEMTSTIKRILDDQSLRQELRQKGLARAKLFSWEDAVKQLAGIIEQVESSRKI